MNTKAIIIQVSLVTTIFSSGLSAKAGYVKQGVKKSDQGMKKGWHETKSGVKKGASETSGGVKKGWHSTTKAFKKVF
jgi:hypothetical protein